MQTRPLRTSAQAIATVNSAASRPFLVVSNPSRLISSTPSPILKKLAAIVRAKDSAIRLVVPALTLALTGATLGLAGCGASLTNNPAAPAAKAAFSGLVHGGQQPVSGAQVYLYAASTSGYGAASTSLLNGTGYVLTDGNGNFTVAPSDINSCPSGSYAYLLAVGGNPGLPATQTEPNPSNPELALAAGLGLCSSLGSSGYFSVNEVTTVAAAYALAGFSSNATSIGTSSNNAAGLTNAFATITNLVDPIHGFANTTTPAGNGTAPTTVINSLANALASCVNSDGTGTPCSNLMSAAGVTGTSTDPYNTFQAALDIAHLPGANPNGVFTAGSAFPAFQPALTQQPNDYTITIFYAGAVNPSQAGTSNDCSPIASNTTPITDLCYTQGIAVDSVGDVWISNHLTPNIVEFSPTGAELTPPGGVTTPSMYKPQQIALDPAGHVWVTSRANGSYADSIQEFTSIGGPISGPSGYTGGGLNTPRGLAIDKSGNVYVVGSGEISLFSNDGTPLSSSGFSGGNLQNLGFKAALDGNGNLWAISFDSNTSNSYLTEFTPTITGNSATGTFPTSVNVGTTQSEGVAIDDSNNVWVAALCTDTDSNGCEGVGGDFKYSNSGTLLSPAGGYTTGGSVQPNDLAIDGSGNVFSSQSLIGEISNSGTGIAPATTYNSGQVSGGGYESVNQNDCCLVNAIDRSGNLWNTGGVYLYETIGLATPVITPLVANLPLPTAPPTVIIKRP